MYLQFFLDSKGSEEGIRKNVLWKKSCHKTSEDFFKMLAESLKNLMQRTQFEAC